MYLRSPVWHYNGGEGRLLKWMKNYYIGNDVKNPTRIRTRITAGKFVPDIYVVTLSDNPGNILEILPAGMLVQRSARATCPLIIGMARGNPVLYRWYRI